MSTDQDRTRLALRVMQARREKFGTVEAAIRAAQINRATWERVESGSRVRDDKLGAIEKALGWKSGDAWRVMAGQEPLVDMPAESPAAQQHETLRQSVLNDTSLTEPIRRAILALLDANAVEDKPAPDAQDEGRRGA